ncbi:MAG TPA: hypothetical protein RWO09_03545 [Ruminococcus sp.]
MAEAKQLPQELISAANSVSFGGKRGDISNSSYQHYTEEVMSWDIPDSRKQMILNKIYDKWLVILKNESEHVSVMVAGPAKYNAKKLDKSDRILELTSEFCEWFNSTKEQVENFTKSDSKADQLIRLVNLCIKPNNPLDPKKYLEELALVAQDAFVEYYDKLYPQYKWRKNSTICKLYEAIKAGTLKKNEKETFFTDDNLTAYTEGERAYIKFLTKPKRQLIVALKSRGWWWNSGQSTWSTYLNRLDKEWVSEISNRYGQYI